MIRYDATGLAKLLNDSMQELRQLYNGKPFPTTELYKGSIIQKTPLFSFIVESVYKETSSVRLTVTPVEVEGPLRDVMAIYRVNGEDIDAQLFAHDSAVFTNILNWDKHESADFRFIVRPTLDEFLKDLQALFTGLRLDVGKKESKNFKADKFELNIMISNYGNRRGNRKASPCSIEGSFDLIGLLLTDGRMFPEGIVISLRNQEDKPLARTTLDRGYFKFDLKPGIYQFGWWEQGE